MRATLLLAALAAAALLGACAPLQESPAEKPYPVECVTPGAPCPPGPQ